MILNVRGVVHLCVIVLALSPCRPAHGQGGTASGMIVGTVTDQTKAVMPNATVTVSGPAMMGVAKTTPDANGDFRIPALNPGVYKLLGIMGQDRGEVESLVTTEAAAGGQELPYTDVNSFDDMTLKVVGDGAQMPQPGTLAQAVIKSGGNSFHGHLYED